MIKVPVCNFVVCNRPGDAYRYYIWKYYNSEEIHGSYLKLLAQCSAAARKACRGVGHHQKDTEDMRNSVFLFLWEALLSPPLEYWVLQSPYLGEDILVLQKVARRFLFVYFTSR